MDKPIGILGGTFDPVHFGHLHSALEIKNILDFDSVRMVPCKTPVHKANHIASANQRYAMLLLATENVPDLTIDDCEIVRDTPSYTIDTLKHMRANYPNRPLCLLLGTDAFMQLPNWDRWQQLLDMSHLIIMQRPGSRLNPDTELENLLAAHLADDLSELHESISGKIYFQIITEMNISSTQIRSQIAAGINPHFLLPANVLDFVWQHNLYQNP